MAKHFEQRVYEFEGFRLDASHLMLYRNTEELTLPPKAVETLLALVEKRGEIVHKDKLMEIIWNDSIVEESNLSQYLHILRKTLGKKSDGTPFIETLRRRGYRFTADIKCGKPLETKNLLNESEIADFQPPTTKPSNAFHAYQLGRMYYHQHTVPGLIESRIFLEESIRLDAKYGLAYAALAELCLMEGAFGIYTPAKSYVNAKDALRQAFDLHGNTAETYAAAGFVDLICDWNFSEAERNLQKSLELNSHYSLAHNYLGQVLLFQCQSDEAIAYLERAEKIEPTGLFNRTVLLAAYFVGRKYQKAIEEAEKMLELNPNWLVASTMRCWALEQTGRTAEAIAVYEKLLKEPSGEFIRRWSGYAYAQVGDEENARKTAALVLAESREHFVSLTHIAAIYAALNEPDEACFYLENALTQRDPWMLYVAADPRFDNLRKDLRFRGIIKLLMSKSERVSYAQANSQ